MRQALHIFRKDVRRARPQIAIVLALTTLVAFEQSLGAYSSVTILVSTTGYFPMLVLAWLYLIASIVHGERLVGNRQFWLTRPYSWQSLLAGKCLSIVAFVHLPVLVADITILRAYGLSPTQGWENLFWRQIALAGLIVLPALALSTITRNLAQFAGVAFGLLVLLAIFAVRVYNHEMDWLVFSLQFLVVLAGTAAVTVYHYARRRIVQACAAFAVVTGFWSGITWAGTRTTIGWIETPSRSDEFPSIRLALARDGSEPKGHNVSAVAEINLPVQVVGLPSWARVESNSWQLLLDNARKTTVVSSSGWPQVDWLPSDHRLLNFPLFDGQLQYLTGENKNFRLVVEFDVYGPATTISAAVHDAAVSVPGVGKCFLAPAAFPWSYPAIACRFAERPPYEIETAGGSRVLWSTEWPLKTVLGASPVFTTEPQMLKHGEAIAPSMTFLLRYRLTRIRRELDLHQVRLTDYLVIKHPEAK